MRVLLATAMAAASTVVVTVVVTVVPAPALAATLTVNSTGDLPDLTLGNGVCETDITNECTLRAAIQEANAFEGADVIQFNIPGSGVKTISLSSALPVVTGQVTIDGYTQPGASVNTLAVGSNAVLLIELDGNLIPNTIGLDLSGSILSVVRGLAIGNFSGGNGTGIFAGTGSSIRGNYIGTDSTGTFSRFNGGVGVWINGSIGDVVVGGASPADRNLISSNGQGVLLQAGTTFNAITGNYIGTDASGALDMGNTYGVTVKNGASTNTISRNLISGNTQWGVLLNPTAGDANSNVIVGNYIGTDATGNAPLPNVAGGIFLGQGGEFGQVTATQIGDGTVAGRNVISGNAGEGIAMWQGSTGTIIRGNYIGVAADGATPLGNSLSGCGLCFGGVVLRNSTSNNRIGGDLPGDGNLIANNNRGVIAFSGSGNAVLHNSFFDNVERGLLINPIATPEGLGPPPNDAGDPDSGANNIQNYPDVAVSIDSSGTLAAVASVDSVAPNTTYPVNVDVYRADSASSGEGREFIGRITLTAGTASFVPFGSADSFGISIGDPIVATATDANGNTSNFSPVSTVVADVAGDPNLTFDLAIAPGSPSTVQVAPSGIAVSSLDRNALESSGAASSLASSSIATIGPADTSLAAVTIGSTPLRAIVLGSTPLRAIPLVNIDVTAPGAPAGQNGWPALLAGTDLAAKPLSNLTFGEALENTVVQGRIAALPLSAIDVSGTPLRAIPLSAIMLGSTPLRAIPLRAIAPGGENPWCAIIAGLLTGGETCAQALDHLNVMEVTLRGVPLSAIPLSAIPLSAIDLAASPLRAIPLRAIDLAASPLRAIPLRAIPLSAINVNGTPLSAIPLSAIPLSAIPLSAIPLNAINVSGTPLSAINVNGAPLRAITVGGLSVDGTPLSAIPLSAIPLRAIDLGASPLRAIPLSAIPLSAIPLRAIDLYASPLSAIPLSAIDVQGSPLSAIPLSAIPLSAIPLSAIPLSAIPLRAIPLSAIPLKAIPLSAINVGGTPLRAIPLSAIDLLSSPLKAIPLRAIPLRAISPTGLDVNCTMADCVNGTLGDAYTRNAVSGAPTLETILAATSGIRLSDLAPFFTNFGAADLAAAINGTTFTMADLTTLDNLTIGDLPGSLAALATVTLGDLGAALNSVTYGDLVGAARHAGTGALYTAAELTSELAASTKTVGDLTDPGPMTLGDLLNSTTGAVTLSQLGSLLGFLTVQQLESVVGQSLQTQINGLTTSLGNLTADQMGKMTLLDIAVAAGDLTLGELLTKLANAGLLDGFTLGDLLLAMLDSASLAFGGVEFASVDVAALPSGTVGSTQFLATVSIDGSAKRNVDVRVALPTSAAYRPGTASVQGQPLEPVVDGRTLVWNFQATPGVVYDIRFGVLPTLRLGSTALTGAARIVGTDISSNKSANVTVAEGLEPNDFKVTSPTDPTRQTTLASQDVVYLTYISTPTDIDVFQINVAENDKLVVQLSNLTADLDVVLWGRPANPAGAAPLGRVSGDAPLFPLTDPDASSANAQPLNDFVRLSDLDSGLRLIQSSNKSGTTSEVISTDRLPAGTYFVQVYGANGATTVEPASLQMKILSADPQPACRANGPFLAPPLTVFPTAPSISASANTLILVNETRLQRLYGASARASVAAAVGRLTTYLGAHGELGVVPVVVPVDSSPTVRAAYDAWDTGAASCDPNAANAVVAAINSSIIDARRGQFKHIVFLGDDLMIPMARLHDGTVVANEYDFRHEFDGALAGGTTAARNSATSSFWDGMILSDDPYGDASARSLGDRFLYVTDAALGRVVETPADIVHALDTFIGFNGTLSVETATVLGYDFLADGSANVASNIRAAGLPVDSELAAGATTLNQPWTRADATAKLAAAGTRALVSLNAHFDHYRALPAAGDKVPGFNDNLIATTVASTLGPDALAQSLVFSMGCHSGLSVSDILVANNNADWSQTLGREGSLFVANTGFGYGDTASVAYTEHLMALFAKQVTAPFDLAPGTPGSSSTVGQALAWAKNQYIADVQSFSVYDEKAVMESTFYGLPFYRIGLTPQVLPAPPTTQTSPDVTGTQSTRVNVTPTNTAKNTPLGTYYFNTDTAGNEQVIVSPGRPIEPKTLSDVSVVAPTDPTRLAQVAHGAIVLNMSSNYVSLPNPVIATPVFDPSGVEPDTGNVAFPTKPVEITTSTGPAGTRQQLVLATGQFRSDPGIQRLDNSIGVVVYYADPSQTDFTAPIIGTVQSQIVAGRLAITVNATDGGTGIDRLYVLVVQNPGLGAATWTGVDLVRSAGTDRWTGSLGLLPGTNDVEFIVQAKDVAGNVGFATNKARNFNAVPQPAVLPPAASLTAAPTTPPLAGGYYAGAVTIAVTSSSPATYSVDGVDQGAVPGIGSFQISGEGFHTWTVTNQALYTQSSSVLIDTASPTLAADPAPGFIPSGTTVRLLASDAGTGVASITYSASGATVIGSTTVPGGIASIALAADGATTITATAVDGAGRSSAQVTFTYTRDSVIPTVAASPTPGLRNTPASVVLTASDGGSGIASLTYSASGATTVASTTVAVATASLSITAQGSTTVTARAVDRAGNSSVLSTFTYIIDTIAPTITCPAPTPTFIYNQPSATLTASVTDSGSGSVSPTAVGAVPTNAVGTVSIPITAIDRAGNSTTTNCSAKVVYRFTGFGQPIDMDAVNTAKSGSAIPVKWRVSDFFNVGVSDPASFVSLTSSVQACTVAVATDEIELFATASGLQYQGDGNWQFNWKTAKGQVGCRVLSLNLKGSSGAITARFQFR